MAFRPANIPAGMTMQQYAELCMLEQIIREPLEIPPPVRKKQFLSTNELKLLSYLMAWCPNFIVFTQVHLLQMIKVDENDIDSNFIENYDYALGDNRQKAYWTVFNMVNLLSVDFILADKVGAPMYAIELDGPEHRTDLDLIQRDKIKTHVLNAVGVPLLRIDNIELSSLNSLQEKIQKFSR